MKLIRSMIFHTALRFATSKDVPRCYSLSDEPGRRFDFTYFRIDQDLKNAEEFSFLAEKYIQTKGLEGNTYDEVDEKPYKCCVPFECISNPKFDIARIYRNIHITYAKPLNYLIGELFQVHFWLYWRRKLSQVTFNKKFQFRADRIDILMFIVELYREKWGHEDFIQGTDTGFSFITLFHSFCTPKVWGHPKQSMFLAEFKFVLDSLIESGDLSKHADVNYKLEAKALKTISQYAEDEARHRDFERHNKSIRLLTFFIAIAAVSQVLITIFG